MKNLSRNLSRMNRNSVKSLCLGHGEVYSILSSPAVKKSCKFSVYKAFLLVLWTFGASEFCTMQGTFSENFVMNFVMNLS